MAGCRLLLRAAALLALPFAAPGAVGLPPVAVLRVDPPQGPVTTTFLFDCAGSSDPDGDPFTCLWDFGDGAGAAGSPATHRYAVGGVYPAVLTVSDSTGESASAWLNVTVHPVNRLPVITGFSPPNPEVLLAPGSSMAFSVTATDPDGDPLTYRWILDGVTVENDGPFYTYRATTPGPGQSLAVVVSDGQVAQNLSWSITVLNEGGPGPPTPTPRSSDPLPLVAVLVAVLVTLTVLAVILIVWRQSQATESLGAAAPSVPWAVWCARCGAPLEPSAATCPACGAPRYRG